MPIRLSAADFQKQFGSSLGNQVVNRTTAEPITKDSKAEKKEKPQIRLPKKREPNKTEMEFIMRCRELYPKAEIQYEAISLRLPSGTVYTPDIGIFEIGKPIIFYEVKGPHIHNERSVHAFKEAKAAFPHFQFIFAQKRESGWTTTED